MSLETIEARAVASVWPVNDQTHFTVPNGATPDLVTQRLLKAAKAG